MSSGTTPLSSFLPKMSDFYKEAFYDNEQAREAICLFIARPNISGALPAFTQPIAERYPDHCNFSRLVEIFQSVMAVARRFPTFQHLCSHPADAQFTCEHEFDGFVWNSKVEYGYLDGSNKLFVNLRMPNDGFAYLPPTHPQIQQHFDPTRPTERRHRDIPGWHPMPVAVLPQDLQALVVYFGNWLSSRRYNVDGPLPACQCDVSAWYNPTHNRVDIELEALLPQGSCLWSLAFEQWCPVRRKPSGSFASDARNFISFQDAQAKMKK